MLAVANRSPVTLSLDPFSQEAPEFAAQVPLFLVIFAAVAVGVLIGGTATWIAQGKHRRARRQYKREVSRLQDEAGHLRAQTPMLPSSLPPSQPPTF
nr:LapA family protein [Microvirga terricola]